MVRNRAIRTVWSDRSSRNGVALDHDELRVESVASEPLEREASARRVRAALESLPERYARVLRLRYFEGSTPTQIAAFDGLPVETVKTRLQRARHLLHNRLRPHRESLHFGALLPLLGLARAPLRQARWRLGALVAAGAALVTVASLGVWGTADDPRRDVALLEAGPEAGRVAPASAALPPLASERAPASHFTSELFAYERESGAPLESRAATLEARDGARQALSLDARGSFGFDAEPGQTWRLHVGNAASEWFATRAGQRTYRVGLPRTFPIRLRTEDVLGRPVAGAVIEVARRDEEAPLRLGVTNAAGEFATWLRAGSNLVTACAEAERAWSPVAQLSSGSRR